MYERSEYYSASQIEYLLDALDFKPNKSISERYGKSQMVERVAERYGKVEVPNNKDYMYLLIG